MAVNVTKITDRFLQIKGFTADDWSTPGDLPGFAKSGIQAKAIKFKPSGANDTMIIKAGHPTQATTAAAIATTATAPKIMDVKASGASDDRIVYFGDRGQRIWPFIDFSDLTVSSAAGVFVEIELV